MLPREFLSQVAKQYDLSQEQQDVFLAKFGSDKNDQEIMDAFHISDGTLRYRLGEIYRKFSIAGKGPGKAEDLLSFLITEYQKFHASGSASSNASETDAEPTQKKQDTNKIDALVQEVGSLDIAVLQYKVMLHFLATDILVQAVLNALVQQVRSLRHDKIQEQCGTMRMLDISQPVALSDIYTDVNILEQITSQQWRDISDFLKGFNPESDNFDRLGLGRVVQERVLGSYAVSRYSKLMVLGKPGSGKTTFLQWVAIKCDLGEFQSDRVPIFIRLKHFADDSRRDDSEFRLLNYISEEFVSCKIPDKSVIETILSHGKALILLDGLDEVSEQDDDEVVTQIRRFADKYFKNQFIITCRIAAQKYRFERFTDVEVADFNDEQVEAFAKKWFVAVAKNNQEEREATTRRFIEKLNLPENQQIRELAVTPILLNLTCLVFQAKGEFPSKRSKLYKQALDILLVKWDESRGIKRDTVYRYLSLEQKIELLSHVAAITFEKSRYFFEQSEVEQCIANYLRTLPNLQTEQATMQRDSQVVLKAIEAQHGLFVERAMEIYSFSHLTFQEYFTAQVVINSFKSDNLDKSVSRLSNKSWREVFLLAAGMIQNADDLLLSMKQKIDAILASNTNLQNFLAWSNHHCLTIVKNETLPAIYRAFFIAINLDQSRAKSLDLDRANMISNLEIQRI